MALSLGSATGAQAGLSIAVNSAKVLGGFGPVLVVNVTPSCDASSGVKKLRIAVSERSRKASGTGETTPTCDGKPHPSDVTVTSQGGALFKTGGRVDITADLVTANGLSVSQEFMTRTAE